MGLEATAASQAGGSQQRRVGPNPIVGVRAPARLTFVEKRWCESSYLLLPLRHVACGTEALRHVVGSCLHETVSAVRCLGISPTSETHGFSATRPLARCSSPLRVESSYLLHQRFSILYMRHTRTEGRQRTAHPFGVGGLLGAVFASRSQPPAFGLRSRHAVEAVTHAVVDPLPAAVPPPPLRPPSDRQKGPCQTLARRPSLAQR